MHPPKMAVGELAAVAERGGAARARDGGKGEHLRGPRIGTGHDGVGRLACLQRETAVAFLGRWCSRTVRSCEPLAENACTFSVLR